MLLHPGAIEQVIQQLSAVIYAMMRVPDSAVSVVVMGSDNGLSAAFAAVLTVVAYVLRVIRDPPMSWTHHHLLYTLSATWMPHYHPVYVAAIVMSAVPVAVAYVDPSADKRWATDVLRHHNVL